ncbi:MAG: DUF1338 domain-containing protein [Bacteroidales bacterium]|nr:DUF1338 domain-containing protein [Bacteroidales bacterium]
MTDENLIFTKLWDIYTAQNPMAEKVFNLFTAEGERVINDHIAFRTFQHPLIGIDVLAQPFLDAGYEYVSAYQFEEKKLLAKHYEHKSNPDAPRVFISELLVREFSPFLQETVKDWIFALPECVMTSDQILYTGNASGDPTFETYKKLREESEYAAWLYVNGFRANHFTVSVNHLQKYDSIQKVNEFLKRNGFLLNDAGGEVQGTPEQLLEQSSIKAGMVKFRFVEGEFEIPGCYYEFAMRYPDTDGKRYSGFISKSADKIFESTNFYKK